MEDKNISRLEMIEWLKGHIKDSSSKGWEEDVACLEFIMLTLCDDDWTLLKDK